MNIFEKLDGTKFNILGEEWTFSSSESDSDELLKGHAAYCDWSIKTIVLNKKLNVDYSNQDIVMKEIVRHEIIHAFLDTCGLGDESNYSDCWARNEEMIDWFAQMGNKIFLVWKEVGCN